MVIQLEYDFRYKIRIENYNKLGESLTVVNAYNINSIL